MGLIVDLADALRRTAALDVDAFSDVGDFCDVRWRFVFSRSVDVDVFESAEGEIDRDERMRFFLLFGLLDVDATGFDVGEGVRDERLGVWIFFCSLGFECSLYSFIICSHIASTSGNF